MNFCDDYPGPEPINPAEWTKGYKFKSGKTVWYISRRRKPKAGKP